MIYLGLWSAKSPADHDRVNDFATTLLRSGLLNQPIIFNGQQYGDSWDTTPEPSRVPVARKQEKEVARNKPLRFLYKLSRGLFLIAILNIIPILFQKLAREY